MCEADESKKTGLGTPAGSEADDFWNIDALMPRRRPSSPAPRRQTEPVDIDLDVPPAGKRSEPLLSGNGAAPIPPRTASLSGDKRGGNLPCGAASIEGAAAEYSYQPENSLIHRVDVLRWHTGYSYYEQFYRSASALEHKTAPECRPVQFFSYMPQYSQLDGEQLAFYLWWRDEVRSGRCPEADYSYVLLYIYELINLYSGTDKAEWACKQLCLIWHSFRAEYPRLDVQLSEWVCDICLINRLPPPFELLSEIPDAPYMRASSLREFYIDCSVGEGDYAEALISYCSNYDWRKSRYAVGETRGLYEYHLPRALRMALSASDAAGGTPAMPRMQDTAAVRDAYVGALCTPRAKKRLRLNYCSFSRSHELRFFVTDILKYAENRLRAAIGIRSRITYGPLPAAARAAVDAYFAGEFPSAARQNAFRRETEAPEYEKLYEPLPENNTLSPAHAAEIELESWQTTDRLIGAFADDGGGTADRDENGTMGDGSSGASCPPALPDLPGQTADEPDGLSALAEYSAFIVAALRGDGAAQRTFAAGRGMLPDSLADEINDIAVGLFGDIILEDAGELYRVIEDYAEDVRAMLANQSGGDHAG